MTAATMALTELAEKRADIDVLRQMVHVWTRRRLQASIDLHLNQTAVEIPAIGLLQVAEDELRNRAAALKGRLNELPLQVTVGRSTAKVGGGTLPKSTMASVTIEMVPKNCSPLDLAARLRHATPPLIGHIANDRFKIDLRTVFPHQDDLLVDAIRSACAEGL